MARPPAKDAKDKLIQFWITKGMKEELAAEAVRRGQNHAVVARDALVEYLARQRPESRALAQAMNDMIAQAGAAAFLRRILPAGEDPARILRAAEEAAGENQV
jgi:hypothetical protein